MLVNKVFILIAIHLFVSVISAQETMFDSTLGRQKGNPDAAIKIEVFNDFQCPSCKNYNEILKKVEQKYSDKVLIIFRHFPLPQHPYAMAAAKATEAARKQGKFFEMMELLYERQANWASSDVLVKTFSKYAERLGLDVKKYKQDFASEEVLTYINADKERGNTLKLVGTPTVLINDKVLKYDELENLEEIVENQINGK